MYRDNVLKNLGTYNFNNCLVVLMVLVSTDSVIVDFVCCGRRPMSTDHVISASFSNKLKEKVKGSDYILRMVVVVKWVYYP